MRDVEWSIYLDYKNGFFSSLTLLKPIFFMENEIWEDVPEYEGFYQVSNLGRVKSLERKRKQSFGKIAIVRERFLKSKMDKDGYLIYVLSKFGGTKSYRLHKIVAKAFLTNPNPLIFNQINHIDGNKLNNCPENLEWCDCTHNNREAVRIGLKGGKPYKPRIDSTPIRQYDKEGNIIKIYENLAQATRENSITKTAICNCLNGRSKSSGGFVWEYVI